MLNTICKNMKAVLFFLVLTVLFVVPATSMALEDMGPPPDYPPSKTPGPDDEVITLNVRDFNMFLETGMLPGDPPGQPSGDPNRGQGDGNLPSDEIRIHSD